MCESLHVAVKMYINYSFFTFIYLFIVLLSELRCAIEPFAHSSSLLFAAECMKAHESVYDSTQDGQESSILPAWLYYEDDDDGNYSYAIARTARRPRSR